MHKRMVSVSTDLSVEVSYLWSFNFFYVDHVCFFTTAVWSVITDESFLVPSPANTEALETALALIHWCDRPHNRVNVSKFSLVLYL